jgi:hypothetical protein
LVPDGDENTFENRNVTGDSCVGDEQSSRM